jgi:peptidoglycan/xylan/chitin deacetylase (PgdA/CDA1 family)
MALRNCTRILAVLAALFLGAPVVSAAAPDSDAGMQLAYLQAHSIVHAGLRGSHTVALTFDDGPNEETTRVLEVLDRYGIKATFFIVGRMAKSHPGILRDLARHGQLLANHTASHAKLDAHYAARPKLLADQLREVHRLIAPLMKPDAALFFRAPYGTWKSANARILNRDPVLKYYVGPIYWDIGGVTAIDANGYIRSSADWDCWDRGWSAKTCAKGYVRDIEAKDGGIVIMHCVQPQAADLLAAVIPQLQREGFKFVRLDQVKAYRKFKTPEPQFRPSIAMDVPRRR